MLKVSETSSERKALISDCFDFKILFMTEEYAFIVRHEFRYKNANFKLRLEFDKYSTKWKMQFFPENSNLCIGQRQTNLICHETPMDPSIVSCAGIHNFILSRTQHSSDYYSVQRGETRLWNVCFVWTWYKYEIWIGKLFDLSDVSRNQETLAWAPLLRH